MRWLIIATVAAVVVVIAALGIVRRTLVVVTVTGPSMAPTLADGDRVLVVRRWARPVRRGDIVAARHPPVPAAARHPPVPAAVRHPPVPAAVRHPPIPAAARHGSVPAAARDWIIKRAVALAGDATPPPEPDLFPVDPAPGAVVAPGTVFLVGDNGAVSADSRLWGALPVEQVVGVMVRRLSARR